MIQLHPEAGQGVQAFANDLCWVAKRVNAPVFGYLYGIGTMLIALPDSTPQEVVGDFWRKYNKGNTNVGEAKSD